MMKDIWAHQLHGVQKFNFVATDQHHRLKCRVTDQRNRLKGARLFL